MMLVHKPQNILLTAPAAYTHRRHPSAPVVVQPTRTPGLLSLSKPVHTKPSPQRLLPSQQRREAKHTPKAVKNVASGVVRFAPAAEVGPALQVTPSPAARGRSHAKQAVKDKAQVQRSSSPSSTRAKHSRQPSPPITLTTQSPTPSQAEASVVFPIQSSNLFDPFSDDSNASPPPSPTLSKPTGKLARRRQQYQRSASPSPAASKAVPVPTIQRADPIHMARSDPLPSTVRPRPLAKRSSTVQEFPVCDESSEKTGNVSPPTTPRRPTAIYRGPRTAPLSAIPSGGFPFGNTEGTAPSAARRGTRKHQRVPSEGVFGMSSDEDVSTGSSGAALSANVQALFGLVSINDKRASLPSTPMPARAAAGVPMRSQGSFPFGQLTREQELEREALEKAAYYASSMFQNSPSPEELPDPLLL
ncbi:hypothetical protein CPC08DRAFT_764442 [Agrocybe pediades]|nr:hypothetical protein CPC08DRAFT_764442 [Agrocybe pediades]